MAAPPDDFIKEFLDDVRGISPPSTPSFTDILAEFDSNEELPINPHPPATVLDSNDASLSGFTPELNTNDDPSTFISQVAFFPSEIQPTPQRCLQIIAQPDCPSKLRYRKDYTPPSPRRDALTNKNPNSSYIGPAVSISPEYLDLTKQYFIGVSLATPMHDKTNCCYIHPYQLESIDNPDYNDRSNNIVWYPIENEDLTGLKSFPDLRIVRQKEDELEDCSNLRPFHIYSVNLLDNATQNAISKREMVAQYNLKKAHLAFFIGQKINANSKFPQVIEPRLTEFSEIMTLVSDGPTDKSNSSSLPDCGVDQYAPRYGYTDGGDLMLIFLTRKPDERKNGKIQITFQSPTSDPEWAVPVDTTTIKVKEQMISFRTPKFPRPINASTTVNVILQQKDRTLGILEYFYIPKFQCATCLTSATNIPNQSMRSYSNKRAKFTDQMYHEESDAMVPVLPDTPVFQSTISVPESISSNTTPEPSTSTTQTDAHESPLTQKLHESMQSLFVDNDYKPLFRLCRKNIQNNPEFLHTAISNNYSDLVSKFIPVAGTELMQKKNQHGKTVLLHAAHLNRLQMVKAALERKESDKLLEDIDNKERNIFHILALNANSNEILDLIINHLLKKSIDISKKFDQIDEDNHTPLQLAVISNNLSATRHFLKYFDKNVLNHMGENVIHLAVRHGDLTMLKYLINEGQLIEQANRTSLVMTPMELAQSSNHIDMVNYLKELYPQPEINEDENSDSN